MADTYYSKEHEWVKVDGGIATMGITDYAAKQLGDVTFVELPKVGKDVKQFEAICNIESVKAASDIFAPVSGNVIEVNDALEVTPEIVNESAEEKAWIARIRMADAGELAKLMGRGEYDAYLGGLE